MEITFLESAILIWPGLLCFFLLRHKCGERSMRKNELCGTCFQLRQKVLKGLTFFMFLDLFLSSNYLDKKKKLHRCESASHLALCLQHVEKKKLLANCFVGSRPDGKWRRQQKVGAVTDPALCDITSSSFWKWKPGVKDWLVSFSDTQGTQVAFQHTQPTNGSELHQAL